MKNRLLMSFTCMAIVFVGCNVATEENFQGVTPFRGDLHNTGVSVTQGLPELTGEKWKIQIPGEIHSSLVLADGTLYFGTEEGHFYAVNATDGEIVWDVIFDGKIRSSAAIYENMLYFTDTTSTLYALDQEDGSVKWKQKLDDSFSNGDKSDEWDYFIGSPTVDQDVIYVGGEGPFFYAINRQDGTIKWEFKTSSFVHGKAAIADGKVYFADMSGSVVSLDQQTGEQIWLQNYGAIQSSLAFKDDVLYFGSRDNYVYALDAKTGEIKWTHLTPRGSWVTSSAAVNDQYVAIGSSDSYLLHVFDSQSGKNLFDFELISRVFSSPVIVDQIAYFGTGHTNGGGRERDAFFALNLETGQELWRFEGTKTPILSSPVVADGVVFFATKDGIVYALH
ncbi:outer membrane protein assembly factor BamB [Paenibacillus anaericanus]|uniref:beta-alanine-activating enzyme beta-propeller domain-containing protein n=1 Tax=Paenibacillus anaericanus TaxID=170367 RepID=UPI00277F3489|nr:PQQ-binding-like beta-propeller repeat protein [Paenibacillus anaericanus]MDQ0088685.1 outer membrane protein assembly factor BamB [Paenibacillus anaericanus]